MSLGRDRSYRFLWLVILGLHAPPVIATDGLPTIKYESFEAAQTAIADMRRIGKSKEGICEAFDSVLRYLGSPGAALRDCLQRFPGATVLRVTSPGGSVSSAIRTARDLELRHMTVEVLGFCGSSCGNYILPVAAHLVVLPYSAVMLHGGPKADIAGYRERLIKAIIRAGVAREEITEEMIATQLLGVAQTRKTHVAFQQEFSVGKNWYDLPFYYEALEREGVSAMLFVSRAFVGHCLGSVTEIGSYWEPKTEAEDAAFRSLFAGPEWSPIWIMGRDIDTPMSC
ncbi:MAG: hypothetical protein GXP15_13740 [Gammaproteobacteria bacterium]|nr:hypothetical protein [Gammaproteobacteria bacterium]